MSCLFLIPRGGSRRSFDEEERNKEKMEKVVTLQLTMFALILVGLFVKKTKLVSQEGQKNITDLVIYIVLPCNIFNAFLVKNSQTLLTQFFQVLAMSIGIQIFSSLAGKLFYAKKEPSHQMSLRYGMICSNAGFLGNPIAEGMFGETGLAMANVFLIPMRIMMWSSGLAIYTRSTDWKGTMKKVITHPCILACLLGILAMCLRISMPALPGSVIQTIGRCNTALSMMVIGMILAEADIRLLFDREVLVYSALRLVLMPALVYLVCRLLTMPSLVTGICVILTGMPAGATTSILASKYHADEIFATKLVVASTLLSMVTIPLWGVVLAG